MSHPLHDLQYLCRNIAALKSSPYTFYRHFILGFITFCIISPEISAQFEHRLFTSNMFIEGKIHYGFFYAHHLELERYNSHFPAFELSLQKQTYGQLAWERAFAYPIIGVTCWYSALGDTRELGHAIGLMPFINFPLYRFRDFFFGFRVALGLGYLTNKFDRLTNYKNIGIGSNFNAAINLMIEARYRVNTWFTFSAGISLQHFSNGALKMPNYGLNVPMANVGLAFWPMKENRKIGDHFYPPTERFEAILTKYIEFYIGGLVGYKNMQAVFGQNFFVFHLYENTLYQVSRKSKFGIGMDLSYDPSHIKILEYHGDTITNYLNVLRPGINAAYELMMSKLGFIFNLGLYLGGQEKSNGPLYEKLSVQYCFSKHLFASVMLKVHFGRADYIGWGIGYRFNVPVGGKRIK
jgi:hypothetical protein